MLLLLHMVGIYITLELVLTTVRSFLASFYYQVAPAGFDVR